VLVWLLPPLHPQLLPVVSFSFIPGSESSPSKGQHNSFKNKQQRKKKQQKALQDIDLTEHLTLIHC